MRDIDRPVAIQATETPLPGRLVAGARDLITAARSERTREAYGKAWAAFVVWCAAHGRQSLPASPETVAAWMTDLAQCGRAPATINSYLAAVAVAHRTAGFPLDRKSPLIADVWKGIGRTASRAQRQARPITAAGLQSLIDGLAATLPADVRDAALLALGWAGALRRSEIVGLDWSEPGSGSGFLQLDERGLSITLVRSKSSQADAVVVVVPCADMPAACRAVRAWIEFAGIKPGEPLFRPIDKAQRIGAGRLTDRSIARIIKDRIEAHASASGSTPAEAADLAAQFSGHSLRAGYATAAASKDVPTYRIQQHTRHKTAEMVARYVREADKWGKSGLKGVGF
ncbi:MAG: site-specific integrase [Hyphomicrobium sp.]